ncbi:hypothetical protein A2533_01585 [Candidatus Falkowbacteria bacterium RIFOXYD2_FULL_35_9]|uniref:Uncharacterized protein n=1 Tax=Candidatus Falkowbacteria bacterium RIFOXYC2_FULL_36_12 TaxID=1798002 RepID=A0A1F5SZ57_9BACT|nr:MAG: hypothetical protein A2478_04805 [Candidatus Falkowbacteria bacterium RIFOXYC2_FULL_36_12]OGF48077.1 MAG: hypothetical protein A2533_01585 [Candidatus Falkowbacteria bacterium RIFOXYD2_FULL_35_9]
MLLFVPKPSASGAVRDANRPGQLGVTVTVSGATDDTDHDGGQDHRTDSQPDAPLGTGRETLLLLVLQAENLVLGELHGGHSGIRGQEERTLGDQAVLTDRADWGARGLGFDHLGGLDRSGDDDDRVVDGRAGGGGRGVGEGGEGEREHPEHGHDGSDTLHGVPPAWVCELVTNFLDLGPIAVILALSII